MFDGNAIYLPIQWQPAGLLPYINAINIITIACINDNNINTMTLFIDKLIYRIH